MINRPKCLHQLILIFYLALGLSSTLYAQKAADWVLHNGQIITMDSQQPQATAIALEGDKIMAIGTDSHVKQHIGTHTKTIDLNKQTVIPGLIDAHLHGIRGGRTYLFETYWFDVQNIQDGLAKLQQSAKNRPKNEWITVVGSWIPEQMQENRAPTVEELSQAVPDHPVYIQSLYDFALVNEQGIKALALNSDTPNIPKGITIEKNAQQQATGKLLGNIGSFNQLFAQMSQHIDAKKNLTAFINDLNSVGVTGFIDPSAGHESVYEDIFAVQAAMSNTQMRIAYRLSSNPNNELTWFKERLAYHLPQYQHDTMAFLGLGENVVMAMNDGVRMAPGFAPKQIEQDKMLKILNLAAQKGVSVELHAYTDDSAAHLLNIIEQVATKYDIRPLRWSLAHLNTGSKKTLQRMKKLGLAYSVQMGPYFETPAILKANGKYIAQNSSPIKKAMQLGIVVAGGTDATRIGIAGIWQAIEYHVTGVSLGQLVNKPKAQLLTRLEALQLYTQNAAWLMHNEKERGSLKIGKVADLVVLNQDILNIPSTDLHKTQAQMTFVAGKLVYQKPTIITQ